MIKRASCTNLFGVKFIDVMVLDLKERKVVKQPGQVNKDIKWETILNEPERFILVTPDQKVTDIYTESLIPKMKSKIAWAVPITGSINFKDIFHVTYKSVRVYDLLLKEILKDFNETGGYFNWLRIYNWFVNRPKGRIAIKLPSGNVLQLEKRPSELVCNLLDEESVQLITKEIG